MEPLSKEHHLATRNYLAEQGVELTPLEVEQLLSEYLSSLRIEMLDEYNLALPESDRELFLLVESLFPL